jgi:hypothetical protein
MRLQVLLAAGLKTTVFWDVALYNLIEIDCHFKVVTASIMRVVMKAVSISEALIGSVTLHGATSQTDNSHFHHPSVRWLLNHIYIFHG